MRPPEAGPSPTPLGDLLGEREAWRARGLRVVFTNGCFDLLHAGHVELLERAAALGDVLVVGINDDASVRRVKGAERPFIPLEERAEVLAALSAVDRVAAFGEDTPEALIRALLPDVLVKGADWRLEEIVGREIVESQGGEVVRVDLRPGLSTSELVRRVREGRGVAVEGEEG